MARPKKVEQETANHDPNKGRDVWRPQPGPQSLASVCPADIVLFGGARGGGKTDCAMGRQINGALRWGAKWNGLFVRKNFKHFAELRRRWDELIAMGLPAIRVGGDGQTNRIKFHNGAMILLTAIERVEQLDFFQGQQFTEISIEEGCQFPFFSEMIEMFKGCMRSPHGVPCRMFITANPGGPGHNQVKQRFKLGKDGVKPGSVQYEENEVEILGRTTVVRQSSVFIPSSVNDNVILCQNDPVYIAKLKSIKDPKLRAAWLDGDWDVVAGGFFDDVWNHFIHVVPRFRIPDHWDRVFAYDHGSAKPFSCGWYAISGGEYISEIGRSFPRGSLIRYREWYGCVRIDAERFEANKGLRLDSVTIAKKVLELEAKHEEANCIFDRIADPSIFKEDDGPSIAEKMALEGVVFRRADNRRISGWDEVRARLRGSHDELVVDACEPMLYIMDSCKHFIRTIPILSRDENDWDDIDTDQEDHIADEVRYACMSRPGEGTSKHDEVPVKTEAELDHDDMVEVLPSEYVFDNHNDPDLLPQ